MFVGLLVVAATAIADSWGVAAAGVAVVIGAWSAEQLSLPGGGTPGLTGRLVDSRRRAFADEIDCSERSELRPHGAARRCYRFARVRGGLGRPLGRRGGRAGVIQSIPGPQHAADLTQALIERTPPDVAVERLLARDPEAPLRQVGVVDAHGVAAGHAGSSCVPFAGTAVGDGVVAQGNMLTATATWTAMVARFAGADGDLAARLLASLHAGEQAGGDVRGRQSAALLVVGGGERIDVRVDDHPDPFAELQRLLAMYRADLRMRAAIGHTVAGGDVDEVLPELRAAQEVFGTNREPEFWECVGLALAGRPDPALLAAIVRANPGWAQLYGRIVVTGRVAS